jgi:hypothetical protein
MDYYLIQAILIAGTGDDESTFWIQILVFLLLAVSWGVYSLVKNRQNEFEDQQENLAEEAGTHHAKHRWRLRLSRKDIALCKGIAEKCTTKTQDMRVHIPSLLQEPMGDFDSRDTASQEKPESEPAEKQSKDLHGGMELLEPGFLLSIVENTEDGDQNDLIMRKLNFNELLRRKKLDQVNSKALKVYAINRGNLYGKDIQCEAMRELAERTGHKSKHEQLRPALSLSL